MRGKGSGQQGKLALLGVGVAAGITVGLAVARGVCGGAVPNWAWVVGDVLAQPVTYAYVGCSTLAVGVLLGWLIGSKAQRLTQLTLTDPLTLLPNRRAFRGMLGDELRRAARYRTPLALLSLDLDYLKDINDAGGHEAGDLALCLVADSLRGSCRVTDLPARVGGDEFVILAPSTTADEALELANRIRQGLRCRALQAPGIGRLTLSIGIADLGIAGACQAEALVSAADGALYGAKAAGRDQARVARGPGSPVASTAAVA